MAVLAVDLDKITAFGQVVDHGLFQLELVAHLVEVGHFQLGATLDLARSGLQAAEHQLEQGGLAGAVGPQQADPILTLQDHGKVFDQHRPVGVMEADVFQHHHLLAGFFRRLDLDVGLAWRSRRSPRSTRKAFNARTRPSFRVRRALMPWRIHTSS